MATEISELDFLIRVVTPALRGEAAGPLACPPGAGGTIRAVRATLGGHGLGRVGGAAHGAGR
jgi:hypothetical protein